MPFPPPPSPIARQLEQVNSPLVVQPLPPLSNINEDIMSDTESEQPEYSDISDDEPHPIASPTLQQRVIRNPNTDEVVDHEGDDEGSNDFDYGNEDRELSRSRRSDGNLAESYVVVAGSGHNTDVSFNLFTD